MKRSLLRLELILCALLAALILSAGTGVAQDQGGGDVLVLDDEKPSTAATPSQKPEISIPKEKEPVPFSDNYDTFYDKWSVFKQAVEKDDAPAVQKLALEIYALKQSQSLSRLTELALSAIRLGQARLLQKDVNGASFLFDLAARMDPTLPAAHYSLSSAYLKRGISGFVPAIAEGIKGFLAPRDHLRGGRYFYWKMVFLVVMTFALLGVALAIVLIVKYNHLLRHDAVEKYSRKYDPGLIELGVWLLLFLPLFLVFGVLWLVPYWLMIFVKYARLQERIAAFVLLVVFLLAGAAYRNAVYEATLFRDPETSMLAQAFLEGPSPGAIMDLQEHLRETPSDVDSAILLASLYERNQMNNQAIDLLQQYVTVANQDPRITNNLATIYFNRGELDYALRLAQKAAELDSRSAIYQFNVSNIYRAKFQFTEANSYMDVARRANPALIEELEQSSKEKVVEVVPTPDLINQRLKGKIRSFPAFLVNPSAVLALVLLGLAAFRVQKNEKRVQAKECMKCGKAFCKKCQPDTKVPGFCIQCLHIFVRKDGVSPASRKEKMGEIELYSRRQRRISRIASLLLPGVGSLLQDRTLKGLALMLPCLFLFALIGYTWRYAGSFFFEPDLSFPIVGMICALLLVLFYVGVNVPMLLKRKSA